MKMNRLSIYVTMLGLAMATAPVFTSCEDMLEEKPYDFISPDDVPDSDDGADILRVWYNPCLHAVWRDIDAYDAFTGEAVGSVRIPPLSAFVSCNGGGKSDE